MPLPVLSTNIEKNLRALTAEFRLREPREDLAESVAENAAGELAFTVLAHTCGMSRQAMLTQTDIHTKRNLSIREFFRLQYRRAQLRRGMPLGAVLKETPFCGQTFYTPRGVFLPRSETEEMAERVITYIKDAHSPPKDTHSPPLTGSNQTKQPKQTKHVSLLDIGTGSGVLAVTLKSRLPTLQVAAIDVSSRAIAVARRNAKTLLPAGDKIAFIRADIFAPATLKNFAKLKFYSKLSGKSNSKARSPTQAEWHTKVDSNGHADVESKLDFERKLDVDGKLDFKSDGKFDFIVSNPPYIGEHDEELSPTVRQFEPSRALFAGPDGLRFYRNLAKNLPSLLKPGGRFFLEIGHRQGPALQEIFHAASSLRIEKDFYGKERFLSGIYHPPIKDIQTKNPPAL